MIFDGFWDGMTSHWFELMLLLPFYGLMGVIIVLFNYYTIGWVYWLIICSDMFIGSVSALQCICNLIGIGSS